MIFYIGKNTYLQNPKRKLERITGWIYTCRISIRGKGYMYNPMTLKPNFEISNNIISGSYLKKKIGYMHIDEIHSICIKTKRYHEFKIINDNIYYAVEIPDKYFRKEKINSILRNFKLRQ